MKIMYLNGALTGQSFKVDASGTTIGRESDNSVQLPMGGVSRYHAKIQCDAAGKWTIRDLGSTNGTFVDDVPVKGDAEIVNGSIITIGDQILRFIDDSAAEPTPALQTEGQKPQGQTSGPLFFFRPKSTDSQQQAPADAPPKQGQQQALFSTLTSPSVSITEAEISRGLFTRKEEKKQPVARTKKILGNVIFALIVFLAACVGLWIFLKLNETPKTPAPQQTVKKKVENPFVLYYEKESVSGSAVFRFTLLVENDRMEVTLDEPLNKRRYYELFNDPIPEELIAKLKQEILDTGFMELQQEKIAGTSEDRRQHRRIMVGFDSKFCDVKVTNDVSETFNRVETIINEILLDEYDLGVISQDVDRILEDAKSFLFVAEEAFRNIDTTPSNLPKAISNYKLALRRYQLFDDPKPAEWKIARDGLRNAEAKMEEIHQDGLRNVRLFNQQGDYARAVEECNRLLEVFPRDSKIYKDIRETKIKLEKKMSVRSN